METTMLNIFQRITALEVKMNVMIGLNSLVLISILKPLGKKIVDKVFNNGNGKGKK